MIIIERSVKLTHLCKEEALSGMTFTGESSGHKFVVTVVDKTDTKVPLTGSVSGKFLRADGTTIALIPSEGYAGIEDGSAWVVLAGNCYTQDGPFRLVITHVNGTELTDIYAFSGYVRIGETNTIVDPENVINIDAIAGMIDEMETATEAAEAAAAFVPNVIAPAYSASATYAVGDYVTKDGYLYRCNTAISTAEAWTAAHWTQVTTGAEVSELKSAIENVESVLKDGTYTSNTYYRGVRNVSNPTNIGPNNARCTSVLFSLDAGDTIAVSGIDSGKKFVIAGAVSPSYDSGWKTSDFAYTVLKTGLYFVNFAMSDGTSAILPSDISATITVSENDILPVINKNDIAKLQEDLDTSVKNTVMQFPYVSGTGHSSSDDKVAVDIKQGQTYYIKSEQKLPYLSVYAWSADGTSASVLSSSNNDFETCLVAANDITALSVYFSAPSSSGTFTMVISYGFKQEIVELQKRSEEVGTVRSRVFNYASGSAHSSASDKCIINIPSGEKYLLTIDSGISGSIQVVGYYGNNQSYTAGNVTGKSDTVFVASQDLFGIGIYFGSQASSGTCTITIRTGSEIDLYNLQAKSDDVVHRLPYAKHVAGNAGTTLTLLHLSDIHAESDTMTNILADASRVSYDDAICTGDMVGGTYTQIDSWWPTDVLTCIGNHDTATYDESTGYDWTALSMADRDAYYIAPFESGWDITHTSGTSYYYKDYAASKVRLIVMDAMLYTGTPGAEAAAQTTWLSGLLTSAISGNLHVLIAIHSPHGGATAKDCSFTRYGQDTMPTLGDCNTPQTVIDTVATAISNGLHFIGYICGHTHQDNIWDAEGDGKQLMYCITCAALTEAQWKNSDQYRNINNNAYNLITIDTTNTLVKIIRGGGADIDDHMRAREAVCFDYSTGQVVGEIH